MNIRHRTPLRLVEPVSAEVRVIGQDWYRVCGPRYSGNPCGPEHDIRVTASGKLYRIGDFTYQRLKNGAEPTPYGWLEITEDGEPVEREY